MVVVWAASKVHSFNPYFLGSLTLFVSKKSNLLLKVVSIYYFIRSCSLLFLGSFMNLLIACYEELMVKLLNFEHETLSFINLDR